MSFDAWYYEIPTITRWYLTLSVLTTAACFFDIISPFSLYLNFRLIIDKYEVRPTSCFRPRRHHATQTCPPQRELGAACLPACLPAFLPFCIFWFLCLFLRPWCGAFAMGGIREGLDGTWKAKETSERAKQAKKYRKQYATPRRRK
jgi:hypothetical protein